MKLKHKLSIFIAAIIIAAIAGIAYTITASNMSLGANFQNIEYLAEQQAEHWEGKLNGYVRALRTMSGIMSNYESVPAKERRDRFDHILLSTLNSEPGITLIYTIWKTDAIDSNDAAHIGRPGSTPTGQYAITYSRESGEVIARASADVPASMEWFNGPNAKKDRIENPMPRIVNEKETYVIIMMVPIINLRTGEVVGGVGCLLDIAMIQPVMLDFIKNYKEVDAITIFSKNGTIMAHIVPERIGKKLAEADTAIFGLQMDAANRAVAEGRDFSFSAYSPVLKSDVEVAMKPVKIENSDMTWSIMVVSSEEHVLASIRDITRLTISAAVLVIIAAAIILFLVLKETI